jgi:hypothetical protein
MKSENVFRAILVVQHNLTPFARSSINEISTKFQLEVFQVKLSALMMLKNKIVAVDFSYSIFLPKDSQYHTYGHCDGLLNLHISQEPLRF